VENINQFDVIVVGAGPAGSAAALVAARAGLKTLLLERGEFPGSKNCSGAAMYGTAVLNELVPDFWLTAPVERYVTRRVLSFMSQDSALSVDFKTTKFAEPPYNAFTVLRPKFDRWLAGEAQLAGAVLLNESVVDSLIRNEAESVIGVRVRREQGEIYAPVVIAADGVNSFLAKQAGLQREFKSDEMSVGVKEVLELDRERLEERFGLTGNEGMVNEFIGTITGKVHGGGFLYTNQDSLSIGVIAQISSLVDQKARAYDLLDIFKQHPSVAPLLRGTVRREYSAHMIPEAGHNFLPKLYTDGLMVAGDAAGLCFATGLYLEGINYAIASGAAAARTAIVAHQTQDFGAANLKQYQTALEQSFVLKDFKRFRHTPEFINSARLQNFYPQLLCDGASELFTSKGQPKRKLLKVAWQQLHRQKVSPLQLARDLWQGGRAFGW